MVPDVAFEGGKHTELARDMGVHRTIPNSHQELAVGTSNTAFDLADINGVGVGSLDLPGHWIFLQARGADVTVKRGAVAITAHGAGFVIKDGDREEFWIDPSEETGLQTWASAAGKLDVLYDSKLPPQV